MFPHFDRVYTRLVEPPLVLHLHQTTRAHALAISKRQEGKSKASVRAAAKGRFPDGSLTSDLPWVWSNYGMSKRPAVATRSTRNQPGMIMGWYALWQGQWRAKLDAKYFPPITRPIAILR